MSSLVCVFDKGVGSFRYNYLNLLFKYQDFQFDIFISFFNFCYSSFELKQNDNINVSASFSPKLCFQEQQIPRKWLLVINNIVK